MSLYSELPALLEKPIHGESRKWEFDTERITVHIVRRDPRWWGRLLLPLAERLIDLAYFRATERTEETWMPLLTDEAPQ
jgi:hypothetical protein